MQLYSLERHLPDIAFQMIKTTSEKWQSPLWALLKHSAKNYLVSVMALILVFFFQSCSRGGRFNDDDLAWFNAYHDGDTIVFESSRQELDTTFIVEVNKSSKNDYGEIIRHISVQYRNKNYYPDSPPKTLISLTKFENGERQMIISYLGSLYVITEPDSAFAYHYSAETSSLIFNTFRDGVPGNTPRAFYWKIDSGLVKYASHDSAFWRRIK